MSSTNPAKPPPPPLNTPCVSGSLQVKSHYDYSVTRVELFTMSSRVFFIMLQIPSSLVLPHNYSFQNQLEDGEVERSSNK